MDQYQRKRLPYGFIFYDTEGTKKIKDTSYFAEKILSEHKYKPVMPSTIDFQDTFEIFGREDIFHLKDHLGDRLALRNDATVQIIKGFCNQLERKHIQPKISRYYYNIPIFTDLMKNHPSLREVQQLGAEIIGAKSIEAVYELIFLADQILKKVFECFSYRLILGDINVFERIKKEFVSESNDLKKTIFRKDTHNMFELVINKGWKKEQAFLFVRNLLYTKSRKALEQAFGELNKTLDHKQKKILTDISEMLSPLYDLQKKLKDKNIDVDIEPLLLRRPKYYTGLLFEGYISNCSFPPLRGGSYDKLVAEYSHQNYPASGFALDITSML